MGIPMHPRQIRQKVFTQPGHQKVSLRSSVKSGQIVEEAVIHYFVTIEFEDKITQSVLVIRMFLIFEVSKLTYVSSLCCILRSCKFCCTFCTNYHSYCSILSQKNLFSRLITYPNLLIGVKFMQKFNVTFRASRNDEEEVHHGL